MISFYKKIIKKAFNQIGLDIIRISKSPKQSLLGLRHLPIKTIIDVGANTGQFARMILNVFPEAHLYSFEPLIEPFKQLKKWAGQQNGKATVYNVALGDKEGEVKMISHLDYSPSSSFLKATETCKRFYPFTKRQATTMVKLTTLDKAIAGMSKPPTPDILIKADVQGYEDRVIIGGAETFREAKACILEVCLDKLYENQAAFKDILFLLDELGYHYAGNLDQAYADNGHVIFIDVVFVKYGDQE